MAPGVARHFIRQRGWEMKIGIIGAENSHSAAIAKIINVQKKAKGFTVDYLWGETRAFAERTAEAGEIPNIVRKPVDMLGKVDAIIVDHRHAKYHLEPAVPFIRKGIPAFIDKPFCYRAAKGKRFLALAKKRKAPVTSYSVIPHQQNFVKFRKEVAKLGKLSAGTTYGPSDLKSKYGGVFFYGIHSVEAALKLYGYDVAAAGIIKNLENTSVGTLVYPSGLTVAMHFMKSGAPGFQFTVVGEKGLVHYEHKGDASPYLAGIKCFTRMFRTRKEPKEYTHANILRPVQVLEAMEKSIRTGKLVKVAK